MERNEMVLMARDIEVFHDELFNYDGYQVVRGEFFAHIYEPTFIFHRNKVSVNSACLKKLPDIDYIQILVNPEKKQLAVLPCDESDKDSFKWCTGGAKRSPRQISCPIFSAKVRTLMDWTPDFKYKLLGKMIDTGTQLLFVYDLKSPEIFVPKDEEGNKMSRKASYPAEWQNQFGIPVAEHQSKLQVSVFNGHAVFSIEEESNHKEGTDGNHNQAEHMHRPEEEKNSDSQSHVTPDARSAVYTATRESNETRDDYPGMRFQGQIRPEG